MNNLKRTALPVPCRVRFMLGGFRAQDASKTPQDASKTPQDAPIRPKTPRRCSQVAPSGAKMPPRGSQEAPRRPTWLEKIQKNDEKSMPRYHSFLASFFDGFLKDFCSQLRALICDNSSSRCRESMNYQKSHFEVDIDF